MAKIELDSVPSTNTWAKEHAAELHHADIVLTHNQTAGRGQRGNSWEAEPGMNLTFSLCLEPSAIVPAEQFLLSEVVALGVAETLTRSLAGTPVPESIRVKWPNDIYAGDRKIAGILIEHSIRGTSIAKTIAGIGLNVNQREFLSPAPNPVSMHQLTGADYPLSKVLSEVTECILNLMPALESAEGKRALHTTYLARLWRNDGAFHPFATPDGTQFRAMITGVEPSGMLTLTTPEGMARAFAFKEVAFIL